MLQVEWGAARDGSCLPGPHWGWTPDGEWNDRQGEHGGNLEESRWSRRSDRIQFTVGYDMVVGLACSKIRFRVRRVMTENQPTVRACQHRMLVPVVVRQKRRKQINACGTHTRQREYGQ